MKKIGLILVLIILLSGLGFLLLQLIPYGRDHINPPVRSEPNWDSPQTRALVKAACFDCHSNETDWSPWYANLAPSSWLVTRDVEEGRENVNFSEWNEGGRPKDSEELWEVLEDGEMPPFQYLIMHPEARLNEDQINQLISGFRNTVQN